MEFREVVRRRHMVRSYTDQPVPAAVVDEILDAARQAPSAGFTQGTAYLVLEGEEQTTWFWNTTARSSPQPHPRWARLRTAPVVVLILANGQAYIDRYGEPDKANADVDPDWPVIDAAFGVMSMLLTATAAGLGALFFSVPTGQAALLGGLGVPAEYRLIGALSLGWPAADDPRSASLDRGRRPRHEVVHRGRWGA